ncbi:MAG: serine/threonine-protein kinase [Verrucomicrobiota bacterium]
MKTILNIINTALNLCPSCLKEVDVSGLDVGTGVVCPYCSYQFSVFSKFDHFRLEHKLGEGGMGSVFQATDENLNRIVAIKVLKVSLSENKKFIETFLREVEITSSLAHPNIVQVYSFGQFEGQYYLVMECLGDNTLDDEISRRKKLSEIEAIDIAIGIASGLNFALQKGQLIHRDIKPGNMMIANDGTPKVVDFGLALTPETADEIDGEIWGTPYYVSPERLEGIPEDFRSDMYSLGVTIYHSLAGRPPFDADTAELVASMHLHNTPLPLATYAPNVSEQTVYAITKCMARHRDDRFQSYDEFIAQLEDAKRRLSSKPFNAAAPPTVTQIEDSVSNNKQAILLIAILVGLVILIIGAYLLHRISQSV